MWLSSCTGQPGPLGQFRHVKYEDVSANITSLEEVNVGHYEAETMHIGKPTTERQPERLSISKNRSKKGMIEGIMLCYNGMPTLMGRGQSW